VLDPNCLEVETAVAELRKYKSPGSDQIQAGGETYCLRSTNSFILFGMRTDFHTNGRAYYLLIYKKG
jgi:hypothetical protein